MFLRGSEQSQEFNLNLGFEAYLFFSRALMFVTFPDMIEMRYLINNSS